MSCTRARWASASIRASPSAARERALAARDAGNAASADESCKTLHQSSDRAVKQDELARTSIDWWLTREASGRYASRAREIGASGAAAQMRSEQVNRRIGGLASATSRRAPGPDGQASSIANASAANCQDTKGAATTINRAACVGDASTVIMLTSQQQLTNPRKVRCWI